MRLNSIYIEAGFEDNISSLADKLVTETTYRMDKALLKQLGIEEEPYEVMVLTNECSNVVSLVKKDDLTTLKTFRREEVAEIVDGIKESFHCTLFKEAS